jgi:hypothetical protein
MTRNEYRVDKTHPFLNLTYEFTNRISNKTTAAACLMATDELMESESPHPAMPPDPPVGSARCKMEKNGHSIVFFHPKLMSLMESLYHMSDT